MSKFLISNENVSNEVGRSQSVPNTPMATQLAKTSRYMSQKPGNMIRPHHYNPSLPTVYEFSTKACNPSRLRRNYAFSTLQELKI